MKKTVRIIAECFVVFVCVFLLTVWNLFSPLDYILRDGLYQRPRGVSGDIKIIGIDERTLERLGPVGTWSRSCYADLLDRLNEDEETRPLVIGFDIIFSGNVDEEGDQAFADRAEKGGNVVTASQLLYSEKAEMDENGIPYYRITGEVLPYEALRKAAISGYTNVAQDSDGTVRRILVEQDYKGESRISPSAARIIYEYYGGKERFPNFDDLMLAVDKVDSGQLTAEEILNPTGWILIGFLMDPRTGLGRFRNFRISNYQLMEKLLVCCATMSTEEILNMPDIQERIKLYNEQTELFKQMIAEHSRVEGDVIISDLRNVDPIYTGNRFMIYSLYPHQNISAWIVNGKGGKGCSVAVGYSILNRTSNVDVGSLMLKYGGGGHRAVGTCQFKDEEIEEKLPMLLDELVNYDKYYSATPV